MPEDFVGNGLRAVPNPTGSACLVERNHVMVSKRMPPLCKGNARRRVSEANRRQAALGPEMRCSAQQIKIWRTGTDAPLGSPSGGAGCPVRGRLRGQHATKMVFPSLRHPLSQPVGCQLSQRESQGVLPYLPAKLQFEIIQYRGKQV